MMIVGNQVRNILLIVCIVLTVTVPVYSDSSVTSGNGNIMSGSICFLFPFSFNFTTLLENLGIGKNLRQSVTTPVPVVTRAIVPVVSSVPDNKPRSTAGTGGSTIPVPAIYQSLYNGLKSNMDSYEAGLGQKQDMTPYTVIFGAELLPANDNIGEGLLNQATLNGVNLYLDRLQSMGVTGVTIPVAYPLYTPQFPRYPEYRTFYQQVAKEVHRRNMTLVVENGILFANTPYSPVKWDYSNVSFAGYEQQKKEMVMTIITDMHPDYLDLGAEPDTEAALTGWQWLLNPDQYNEMLIYVTDGLDRGPTKLGAGIGTWGNTAYIDRYAKNPGLEFISIHVYPVVGTGLTNIGLIATTAHTNNKPVIMDEAWLYKATTPPNSGIGGTPAIFSRDVYSFWAPLDEEFLRIVTKAARTDSIDYISPFWSELFFGNIDYSPSAAAMSYNDLRSTVNRIASVNLLKGTLTPTGSYYKQLTGN